MNTSVTAYYTWLDGYHNIFIGYLNVYSNLKQWLIISMLLFLFSFKSLAGAEYKLIRQYTVKDGLLDNGVLRMVKDSRGYYWLAAGEGLSRFDGNKFLKFYFDDRDTNTISNNYVTEIISDKLNGNIWVATRNGLCKVDPYTLKITRIKIRELLENNEALFINDITQGPDDRIYLATSKGIYQVNNNEELIKYPVNSYDHFISQIESDDRNLYIAFNSTFLEINGDKIKSYKLKEGESISYMYRTNNRYILLRTFNGSTYKYDILNKLFLYDYTLSSMDCFNGMTSEFTTGNIHYFTNQKGMYSINLDNDSLATVINWNNRVQFADKAGIIFIKKEGNTFWVTSSSGIYLWKRIGTGIQTFEFSSQLKRNQKTQLYKISNQNAKQDCWIANISGELMKYNFKSNKILPLSKSLAHYFPPDKNNLIQQICNKNDSTILFIHENQGVIQFDLNSEIAKSYNEIYKTSVFTGIITFFQENDTICWLGKVDGLYKYSILSKRLKKYTNYHLTHRSHVYSGAIESIIQDNNKIIWILPQVQRNYLPYIGRILPNTDSITMHFTAIDNSILSHSITRFNDIENDKNNIYMATDRGIVAWPSTGGEIKVNYFLNQSELAYIHISRLLHTNPNYLWAGTSNGLLKIDLLTQKYETLLTEEGMHFNHIGRMYTFENKIFVLFSGAITVVDPLLISKDIDPLFFSFSSVRINGHIYPVNKIQLNDSAEISMPYFKNNFIIDIGKSVQSNHNEYYKYRLLPIDKEWQSSSSNQINYPNLSPGIYSFEISPAHANRKIHFVIHKPFWLTLWFRAFILALIGSLIWYFIKIREKNIKAQYTIKQRISTDLHDEVGSALSSINILTNAYESVLAKDPIEAKQIIKSILSQSSKIQQNMSDIIWALRGDTEKVSDLLVRMKEYTGNTLEKLDITVTFELIGLQESLILPMHFRKEVLLVFKEAVNNIAKHSGATTVVIGMSQEQKLFQLTVSDDGKGIETKKSTGLGLLSMADRVKKLNGKFDILSTDQGTLITTKIPIP